jgi:hypothetical protein
VGRCDPGDRRVAPLRRRRGHRALVTRQRGNLSTDSARMFFWICDAPA